jgi:hypothetical protein
MAKAPCENCIALPICRSKLEGGDMINLMCLSDECPLLKAFIRQRNYKEMPSSLDIEQLSLSVEEGLARIDIVEAFYVQLGVNYKAGGVDLSDVRPTGDAM